MASPGELIKTTAAVLGTDPVRVGNIYRVLREAGLVTKGGRGPSAAVVSPSDAATLLFGICGCDAVKDAPAAVKEYAELQASFGRLADWTDTPTRLRHHTDLPKWKLNGCYLNEITSLPVCHKAIDAVATFIALFARKSDKPSKLILSEWEITVGFEWPIPSLSIEFYAKTKNGKRYSESMHYFEPHPGGAYIDVRHFEDESREKIAKQLAEKGHKTRLLTGDLKVFRSFGIATLSSIGCLIKGD